MVFSDSIGKVSGNTRVDPDALEEQESDNEETWQLWLFDVLEGDEEFLDEVMEMVAKWEDKIEKAKIDPATLHVHMTGESHLDMAYKWRYEQTVKKVGRTLSKAVKHAKAFPEFRFSMSSPQLLEWLADSDPELLSEVRERVKSGNIIPVGGSWVEADCMMPSGESFTRQRLFGMMKYKDEFGVMPIVEWYPDSFGYNVGLPQILVKSGARYFLTSKLDWNKDNDYPFVHFWWKSPDGSKILSANTSQQVFNTFDTLGYRRHLLKDGAPQEWSYKDEFSAITDALDPDAWATPVSFFYGAGDGGHGPTHRQVAEMLGILRTNERTRLTFAWSTPTAYFQEVEQYKDRLPTWGDLAAEKKFAKLGQHGDDTGV